MKLLAKYELEHFRSGRKCSRLFATGRALELATGSERLAFRVALAAGHDRIRLLKNHCCIVTSWIGNAGEVPVRVDAFNSSGFSTGGMLRVRSKDIKADPWIQPGANGSHSMVGVLANEARVCLIDLSTMGVQVSGSDKRSILKGIDLNTGESRMTVLLPGTRTLCNDIAVGSNKAVYVTNSFRAANPFAAARFQPDGGLG